MPRPRPATWVTPADADAYCAWLAQRTGHPVAPPPPKPSGPSPPAAPTPTGNPSAATRGARTPTPSAIWAPSAPPSPRGAFPTGVSWCGTWEQAGNVWDGAAAPLVDPTAELTETGDRRPLRGGSYACEAQFLRISHRASAGVDERFGDVGFRCVVG
ncbi:MAG: SUMF1/EgtB/PvdO family nonheme iron enzyme [bacterium]